MWRISHLRRIDIEQNIFNLLEAIRGVLGVEGGMVVGAAVDVVVYVTGSMVDCEFVCMVVSVFVIIDVLLDAFVDEVTRSIFVFIPITVDFCDYKSSIAVGYNIEKCK